MLVPKAQRLVEESSQKKRCFFVATVCHVGVSRCKFAKHKPLVGTFSHLPTSYLPILFRPTGRCMERRSTATHSYHLVAITISMAITNTLSMLAISTAQSYLPGISTPYRLISLAIARSHDHFQSFTNTMSCFCCKKPNSDLVERISTFVTCNMVNLTLIHLSKQLEDCGFIALAIHKLFIYLMPNLCHSNNNFIMQT